MERSFRDAFDKGRKESKDAGGDMSRNIKRSMDDGIDSTKEFKQEAVQNVSEVASSFTGDLNSAVDLVQGTLGGLAASIPGWGLALAGLGAGVGAVYSMWREEVEKTEERVTSMYENLQESGLTYLNGQFVLDELNKIYSGADDAAVKYQDLKKYAEELGVSEAKVASAFAGDMQDRQDILDTIIAKSKDMQKPMFQPDAGVESILRYNSNYDESTTALLNLYTGLTGLDSSFESATARAEGFRDALSEINPELAATMESLSQEQELRIKVTADPTHLRRSVQGILDDSQFRLYANARNAQGTYGRPLT